MIRITINGQTYDVPEGSTVLEAARENGIHIPTLCYHPQLKPLRNCRLCLVEVEGVDRPLAACETPVQEGMVVRTDTPELNEMRRGILEMLIAAHPVTGCYTCDRAGNCEFQDFVFSQNLPGQALFTETYCYPVIKDNPFIVRDYEKCILCGRCVAACAEHQARYVLDYLYSGFKTKIGPEKDGQELASIEAGCTLCGNCVQVCPTGALVERNRRYEVREWEMKPTSSVCPYCGVGCNVELYAKGRRVVKVKGRANPRVNGGWLCVKGRYGLEFIGSDSRLKKPLIRAGAKGAGKFREATWEEALDYVAENLGRLKKAYGPQSLAVVGSARCTNEDNYVLQKFARVVLGTNNIDHVAPLWYSAATRGLEASLGTGAMTNSLADMDDADCILLLGSGISKTCPVIGQKISHAVRYRGARLILIDQVASELAELAAIWLRPKPGTEVALINGLMNVIVTRGLSKSEFIARRTEGFKETENKLGRYTPEYVAGITGVPAEDVASAATCYARGPRSAILYALETTQYEAGANLVQALANLALACGYVGTPGAGINLLCGSANLQGARDMGVLPDLLPGHRYLTDTAAVEDLEQRWKVTLPKNPGLSWVEMLSAAQSGQLKGMYIMGEDLIPIARDAAQTKKSLVALEFLVVQDMFLTETARYADVILPAAAFAEREGTFTSVERRVQKLKRALDPPAEARPEWEPICELARRLGQVMEYESAEKIMAEIAASIPDYAGINYQRLDREQGVQWPCPTPDHPGTPILYEESFIRGRAKFHAVEQGQQLDSPDEAYPFYLLIRMPEEPSQAALAIYAPGLEELPAAPRLEINPHDAARLGIKERAQAKITSRYGGMEVQATTSYRVPEGMALLTCWPGDPGVSELTGAQLAPGARATEFRAGAVKITTA